MYKIKLFAGTKDDSFVTEVTIPPFIKDKMPDVIIWGSRSFKRIDSKLGFRYEECFTYMVPPEYTATT